MDETYERAYQRLFDAFVLKHKLDIEFDNWPKELEEEFRQKVETLKRVTSEG